MLMFGEFFDILKEADKEAGNMGMSISNNHVFGRLNKTHVALNEKMEQIFFEQYGIKGITIDNIEDVYDSRVTGLGDMMQTRDHLISKGMSGSFADYLARRYIKKVERESDIYTIMDFFDHRKNADASQALHSTSFEDMRLNY